MRGGLWAGSLRVATVGVLIALGLFVLSHTRVSTGIANRFALDFRVVYCGERAVLERADPYLTEPLRSCERAVRPERGQPAWAVTPYPLPGYSAALLLPFGLAPYDSAWWLWFGALIAAFVVATAAVASIVRTHVWLVTLVFAPTVGLLNLDLGEPIEIAIACIALAALALERDRPKLAAVAAAFAMIEPSLGLPACCALFAVVPAARVALAGFGAAFVALSLAAIGGGATIRYFTVVLPLHAHAEIFSADQYSLTRALFVSGVPAHGALVAGSIWYAAAIVCGSLAAARACALGASRALVVLLPVATAMLGGSFVHDVEIAAALPAALVLARRSVLARAAVTLLSMRWALGWRLLAIMQGAAVSALLAIALPQTPLLRRTGYVVAILTALFAIDRLLPVGDAGIAIARRPPVAIRPSTPASIPWEWSIRLATDPAGDPRRALLAKIPTWLALAAIPLAVIELDVFAAAEARRRRIAVGLGGVAGPIEANASTSTTG